MPAARPAGAPTRGQAPGRCRVRQHRRSGDRRAASHDDACGPGVLPGPGNICTNPLLVDPAHGNVHEKLLSPAIDAGANGEVAPGLTTDLDGDARVIGAAVDIGADEFKLS